MKVASFENRDISTFEEKLSDEGLIGDQKRVLVSFWTNERDKIVSSLRKKCTWNRHLQSTSWRIDVKAASKSNAELNVPVVLFEIKSEAGVIDNASSGVKVAKFEMDRTQVGEILTTLDNIQKKFEELTS